jgi:hypothetical protein
MVLLLTLGPRSSERRLLAVLPESLHGTLLLLHRPSTDNPGKQLGRRLLGQLEGGPNQKWKVRPPVPSFRLLTADS